MVIVEVTTDVMAMHLAGVTTGRLLRPCVRREEHLALIRRLMMDDCTSAAEVIYTFDGDDAGKAAALRHLKDRVTRDRRSWPSPPTGTDPCELRQRSGDGAVRDPIARRVPMFAFAIRRCCRRTTWTPPRGRATHCATPCRWW